MKLARVISIVMLVVVTTPVHAIDFSWNINGSGLFDTTANWTPAGGPPDVNTDTAIFDQSGTYTVTFQTSKTNNLFRVRDGNVTFALSGQTYTLTANSFVGDVAGQTGRLTVSNGNISGTQISIGWLSPDVGQLTVSSNAVLDLVSIAVGSTGTGTLTIQNGGDVTSGFSDIAGAPTATGTATVTGAGSSWTTTGQLGVGRSGAGSLSITSGGLVNATSTLTTSIGLNVGSQGTLTVSGAGSMLSNADDLTIGQSGQGSMSVTSGGTANVTGATPIGLTATASGSLTVSGGGSAFTGAALTVGSAGDGAMVLASGGTVNSQVSNIALSAGSTGSVTVSGSGSTWNASSLAIGGALGGNGGTGTLTVETGGTVNVTGATEIRNSAGTSLTLDGGTLVTGGTFTRLGTFNFRDGTLHVKGIYNHGAAAAALVIDGAASGDLATLRLSGNFAVQNVTTITVGNNNQGALVLDSGRVVNTSANNIAVGAFGLSSGTISVSGNGTSLMTAGTLSVGGTSGSPGGAGAVNIGAGATVDAGLINLFAQGVINLNGGTLRVGNFVPQGGSINFNAGEVTLTIAVIASETQLDAILGASHVLGAGRRLSGTTSLSFNAPLTVSGGDVFATTSITNLSTLQVNDGSLVATTTLTNSVGRLLAISGTATVTAASGITNNGTIQLDENLIATSGGTLTNSGTIRGSGFVGNNLTNNSVGQVQATTGDRLEFQGATNTNSGSISLVGGEIVFTGSLTNSASTGLISGGDAILRFNSGITNQGSLAASFGTSNVFGDINNTGSVVVSGGAAATFHDDITQNGTFKVSKVGSTTSTAVVLGAFTGGGGSTGGGDIFFDGDLRPGNSPATVSFGNNIGLGSGTTLGIELGGTSPGTQYDQVHVSGSLSLDGTFAVSLINSFSPVAGNSFDILNWGTLSGMFSAIQLPTLADALTWNTSQLYTTGVLSVVSPGVPGDYNDDGKVDAADYVVWRKYSGTTTMLPNDPHGGSIGALQFNTWRANFGNMAGSGAGASAGSLSASVPEPGTLVILVVGILVMSFRRRAAVS